MDQPLNAYLDLSEALTLSADASTADLMTTLRSTPPDQWSDLEVRLALSALIDHMQAAEAMHQVLWRFMRGGLARER